MGIVVDDRLSGREHENPPRLPDFLIVGAVRSGTTSLAHHLASHPDIALPLVETHFFDRRFADGLDWYSTWFVRVRSERAVGEKTATYLYKPGVPARIAATLPDVRIIAVLRNPVDRAYSHYWMRRARGLESRAFSEVVLEECTTRTYDSYLQRGRYLSQLRRFLEHYERDRLLVLLLEDLAQRPRELFKAVCRFLEVDADFVPPNIGQVMNGSVSFRSLRLRDAIHPKGGLIPKAIARMNSRRIRYPPMDDLLRARLLAFFHDDNRALASWLGRDLEEWWA